uniref:Calmodulin n=1 Tax=Rhizophora mucronata TaxID=61149 RepID=A0A2P2MY53_RHIMU
MATHEINVLKASKWFSNKGLRLSFQRRRSESTCSRKALANCSTSKVDSPNSPNSPLTPPKSASREEKLEEVFRYFDGNGDGKISAVELRAYFGSIGEYMSYEDAQGVIKEHDTDGDDLLDFEDFLRLMKRGADNEDLKQAFEMFQLEKGDGCITPGGLQRMLQRLGDERSLDDCVAMINVFDSNGDGVLDFHEFHQMMA